MQRYFDGFVDFGDEDRVSPACVKRGHSVDGWRCVIEHFEFFGGTGCPSREVVKLLMRDWFEERSAAAKEAMSTQLTRGGSEGMFEVLQLFQEQQKLAKSAGNKSDEAHLDTTKHPNDPLLEHWPAVRKILASQGRLVEDGIDESAPSLDYFASSDDICEGDGLVLITMEMLEELVGPLASNRVMKTEHPSQCTRELLTREVRQEPASGALSASGTSPSDHQEGGGTERRIDIRLEGDLLFKSVTRGKNVGAHAAAPLLPVTPDQDSRVQSALRRLRGEKERDSRGGPNTVIDMATCVNAITDIIAGTEAFSGNDNDHVCRRGRCSGSIFIRDKDLGRGRSIEQSHTKRCPWPREAPPRSIHP